MSTNENQTTATVRDAWGMLYDLNGNLPNFYLTSAKGTFWVGRDHRLYQKNNAPMIEYITSHKLFKLKQQRDETYDDIFITIEPAELDADILVNGYYLLKETEVLHGRCEITSEAYDMRLKFEAFCDVSEDKELSSIGPNYRYINLLGKGGFAIVYKGFDVRNERFCAIKTARSPEINPELKRENKLTAALTHENIIKVLGDADVNTTMFLITEFAAGGSLRHRIDADEKISEPFARRIFRHLFSACAYIHEKNFLHRDLKPHNIVLTSTDDDTCLPKIIDFGLSCYTTEYEEMDYIVGSYEYMAPEILSAKVFRGRDTYTPKTDVWGLGMCLYMSLNRCKPFVFNEDLRIFRKSMDNTHYEKLEGYKKFSKGTRHVIENCLKIDFRKRPTCPQLLKYPWVITSRPFSKRFSSLGW